MSFLKAAPINTMALYARLTVSFVIYVLWSIDLTREQHIGFQSARSIHDNFNNVNGNYLYENQQEEPTILEELRDSLGELTFSKQLTERIGEFSNKIMHRADSKFGFSSMKAPVTTVLSTAGLLLAVGISGMAAGASLFFNFHQGMNLVNTTMSVMTMARSYSQSFEIWTILSEAVRLLNTFL